MNKVAIKKILSTLKAEYGGRGTALHYNSEFELLVAVILSAQCTDERVNITTARLFPAYSAPGKMLELGEAGLAELIRDCGLFRTKAKNIIKTCKMLIEKFACRVPDNMNDLLTLPGVGRKTANVLLSIIFGVPAIAVDTHVFRVAKRLFSLTGTNPLEIELQLQKIIPQADWSAAHHWFIWHGRLVCKARVPLCQLCVLNGVCKSQMRSKK